MRSRGASARERVQPGCWSRAGDSAKAARPGGPAGARVDPGAVCGGPAAAGLPRCASPAGCAGGRAVRRLRVEHPAGDRASADDARARPRCSERRQQCRCDLPAGHRPARAVRRQPRALGRRHHHHRPAREHQRQQEVERRANRTGSTNLEIPVYSELPLHGLQAPRSRPPPASPSRATATPPATTPSPARSRSP